MIVIAVLIVHQVHPHRLAQARRLRLVRARRHRLVRAHRHRLVRTTYVFVVQIAFLAYTEDYFYILDTMMAKESGEKPYPAVHSMKYYGTRQPV